MSFIDGTLTGFGELNDTILFGTGLNHPTIDPNSSVSTGMIYDPDGIILNKDFGYYSDPPSNMEVRFGPDVKTPFLSTPNGNVLDPIELTTVLDPIEVTATTLNPSINMKSLLTVGLFSAILLYLTR